MRARRLRSSWFVLAAVLGGPVSGCAHVRPWERGRLAEPSMTPAELEGPGEAHVQAIHEGATGGGMTAESGCGCN